MCDDEPVIPQEEEGEECICVPKDVKKVKIQRVLDELPCTCPYDPRFPNANQTRRCFVNFYDYQRCIRLLGNYQGCRIFKICYQDLCPNDWINKWYEDMEKGTFPCIYPPKPDGLEEPDESEPFDTAGY